MICRSFRAVFALHSTLSSLSESACSLSVLSQPNDGIGDEMGSCLRACVYFLVCACMQMDMNFVSLYMTRGERESV